jgi:hypothetical protein
MTLGSVVPDGIDTDTEGRDTEIDGIDSDPDGVGRVTPPSPHPATRRTARPHAGASQARDRALRGLALVISGAFLSPGRRSSPRSLRGRSRVGITRTG